MKKDKENNALIALKIFTYVSTGKVESVMARVKTGEESWC
jgi:hypothetical protein